MKNKHPIRLLLVDDHKILRQGLKEAIAHETDMELAGEAGNGRSALILAEKLRPDVVVMDISMPDLNGIEATRQLLKRHPDQKIIALSMYSDKQYVMGMLKSGVAGYILKTNAFDELAHAIRQVMSGHSYMSAQITKIVIKSALENGIDLPSDGMNQLSSSEIEILQLIAEGKTTEQIATRLNIGKKTVERHRKNLRQKLKLNTIAELTRYAIQKGIISL